MANEKSKCFAWFISFKNSWNERWAKFRNRFRRRFYARRDRELDLSTLLNETGTRDFVITKKPYKPNQVCPSTLPHDNKVKEGQSNIQADDEEIFDKLVGKYVTHVIAAAAEALRLENRQSLSNTTLISGKSAADDNESLPSSVISQMADTAVAESLTNIVLGSDRNQSAVATSRSKTLTEIVEMFCVVRKCAADNGLLSGSD